MQECKNAYSLTWAGVTAGGADTATCGKPLRRTSTAQLPFKATLSIARKPKYFLGIKIHRAIMQISWELTAEYSDTEVVDIIELDPAMSESEKATLVNDRLSEIARQYPSCEITTEYVKSEPVEEDTTTDTYHLLWASDRLEIARQVEARLTNIYADLVCLGEDDELQARHHRRAEGRRAFCQRGTGTQAYSGGGMPTQMVAWRGEQPALGGLQREIRGNRMKIRRKRNEAGYKKYQAYHPSDDGDGVFVGDVGTMEL